MSHLKYNICEVSLITFMILQSHVANFQALHSALIWCRRPNQASTESNRLPKGSTKTDYAENFIRTKQKNSTNGRRGTPIAFLLMASSFICPQQWEKKNILHWCMQPRPLHGLITIRIFPVDMVPCGFTQTASLYVTFLFLVKSGTVDWERRKTWPWY